MENNHSWGVRLVEEERSQEEDHTHGCHREYHQEEDGIQDDRDLVQMLVDSHWVAHCDWQGMDSEYQAFVMIQIPAGHLVEETQHHDTQVLV
jgi:hypothetical protein